MLEKVIYLLIFIFYLLPVNFYSNDEINIEKELFQAKNVYQDIYSKTKDPKSLLYYGHGLVQTKEKKEGLKNIQYALIFQPNLKEDFIIKSYYPDMPEKIVKFCIFLSAYFQKKGKIDQSEYFYEKAIQLAPDKRWIEKIVELYFNNKEIVKCNNASQSCKIFYHIRFIPKRTSCKLSFFSFDTKFSYIGLYNKEKNIITFGKIRFLPENNYFVLSEWNGIDQKGTRYPSAKYYLKICNDRKELQTLDRLISFDYYY